MYIIYNNDGSIRETNFAEIINRGNDGHNSVFVGFANNPDFPSEYEVYALFKLPSGEVAGPINGLSATTKIDDVVYHGLAIPITSEVTQYPGQVKMTVYVKQINVDDILYTYPAILVINDTGIIPPDYTKITLSQYQALLSLIDQHWNKTVKTEGDQTVNGNKSFGGYVNFDDDVSIDGILNALQGIKIDYNFSHMRGIDIIERNNENNIIASVNINAYGFDVGNNEDPEPLVHYTIAFSDIGSSIYRKLYKHTIQFSFTHSGSTKTYTFEGVSKRQTPFYVNSYIRLSDFISLVCIVDDDGDITNSAIVNLHIENEKITFVSLFPDNLGGELYGFTTMTLTAFSDTVVDFYEDE